MESFMPFETLVKEWRKLLIFLFCDAIPTLNPQTENDILKIETNELNVGRRLFN